MLFSVIIPTYNRRELLQSMLESLWAQTFQDFEIIVVDDGSDDGTCHRLQEFGGRVRPFHQQHAGPAAARNHGARNANGRYLAFLDSDDVWFPWTLATFAALIDEHKSPAVLAARVQEFEGEQELGKLTNEPLRGVRFDNYLAASETGYYLGGGMAVINQGEFANCGGYVELPINAEDHDLALRLGTTEGFVQVLAPVTLGWRRHCGGLTKDVRRTYDGCLYLINQERIDAFPGGTLRRRQRREIICRHVRPVAVECLRQKLMKEAWLLYRLTLCWHIRLGRWRFLVGFPFLAIRSFK